MKKVFAFLLVGVLLLAFSSTVYAAEPPQNEATSKAVPVPMYTYILHASADLDITSGGRADMSATLSCFGTADSCKISAYLQRYVNGAWSTVQHYAQNFSSDYGAWGASYYVTSGYNYRLKVYYYAYSGNETESTSLTSTEHY